MTKRLFDIFFAALAILILAPVMAIIALAIRVASPGPALFWSERFGKDEQLFAMPKFRTMKVGTPSVATHLLKNGDSHVTPIGRFLRRTSLDELPQLYCILKGNMSFVGPRPALFNQADLMALRRDAGVHRLVPGVTGWAQINGRDTLTLEEKVCFESEYLEKAGLQFDCSILLRTALQVFRRDGIAH